MKNALASLALVLLAPVLAAQGTPPSTDIWLVPLTISPGNVRIGIPRNVTQREGYDNQPSFTPDSRAMLYTARMGDQTDVFRLDIASGQATRLTSTPESEYSPTVMPAGARFSVVRVEADSSQRLWSFAPDGSDPRLVLPGVEPVGYHVWLADSALALFVIGAPNTLEIVTLGSERADTVARDIGRALVLAPPVSRAFPEDRPLTFVQRDSSGDRVMVMHLERRGRRCVGMVCLRRGGWSVALTERARLPEEAEYLAWTSNGALFTAEGTSVYQEGAAPGGGRRWTKVADFARHGMRNLSRLAVSPDGRWLAIVAEPAGIPVTKDR